MIITLEKQKLWQDTESKTLLVNVNTKWKEKRFHVIENTKFNGFKKQI